MRRIAILYSGGTDSTASAALAAASFPEVALLTFKHSGHASIGNSRENVVRLRSKFPEVKFTHDIIGIDRLFRHVTYDGYRRNFFKYGLFNLSTCLFCRLSMHLRALVYCLDNKITEIADGANINSSNFNEQMEEFVDAVQRFYCRFGLSYSAPVYSFSHPGDIDWQHKLGLTELPGYAPPQASRTPDDAKPPMLRFCCGQSSWSPDHPEKEATTGQFLHQLGILPEENVKGKRLDRKLQPRCFQLTLLNLFAVGYYLPRHGLDRYRQEAIEMTKEKISSLTRLVEQYIETGESSRLGGLLKLSGREISPHEKSADCHR